MLSYSRGFPANLGLIVRFTIMVSISTICIRYEYQNNRNYMHTSFRVNCHPKQIQKIQKLECISITQSTHVSSRTWKHRYAGKTLL